MRLYSILVATFALAFSTAFAGNKAQQHSLTDCLNLCKDDESSYSCPPDTKKSQLSNGCWTCCDTE
ncbi:hypothetical protein N7507_001507 [Penicillium longicatenatum]|nr:hypothetical protein N7507_001507 [Penicillium longicatenatum]